MSARRVRRMFFSCDSAQLGGDLVSTTSSAAALPQLVPHPRGWLDVETCAAKRQFAKGPSESPRACSRSVPQVSNGSDAQNGRARRRLFHWDDFCALLLIRVNASNRPQAGGYPPYTLLLLAASRPFH